MFGENLFAVVKRYIRIQVKLIRIKFSWVDIFRICLKFFFITNCGMNVRVGMFCVCGCFDVACHLLQYDVMWYFAKSMEKFC